MLVGRVVALFALWNWINGSFVKLSACLRWKSCESLLSWVVGRRDGMPDNKLSSWIEIDTGNWIARVQQHSPFESEANRMQLESADFRSATRDKPNRSTTHPNTTGRSESFQSDKADDKPTNKHTLASSSCRKWAKVKWARLRHFNNNHKKKKKTRNANDMMKGRLNSAVDKLVAIIVTGKFPLFIFQRSSLQALASTQWWLIRARVQSNG